MPSPSPSLLPSLLLGAVLLLSLVIVSESTRILKGGAFLSRLPSSSVARPRAVSRKRSELLPSVLTGLPGLKGTGLEDEELYMQRALSLAVRAAGNTRPNPMVGCVITSPDGYIVGEGFHPKAGEPHAERMALKQAGEKAKGGTAYVTLEPCSHHGRTPPCTEGLIEAGVAKVVPACVDPNPVVAGSGLRKLVQAGIEVGAPLCSREALSVNMPFFHKIQKKTPFGVVHLKQSAEGELSVLPFASPEDYPPTSWVTRLRLAETDAALLSASASDLFGVLLQKDKNGEAGEEKEKWDFPSAERVVLDWGLGDSLPPVGVSFESLCTLLPRTKGQEEGKDSLETGGERYPRLRGGVTLLNGDGTGGVWEGGGVKVESLQSALLLPWMCGRDFLSVRIALPTQILPDAGRVGLIQYVMVETEKRTGGGDDGGSFGDPVGETELREFLGLSKEHILMTAGEEEGPGGSVVQHFRVLA
uniref:Riboflavin biosynthesis protein PYRD, chloroplastic n=1 Tax=Chromera velia CCMP2878 TaxID=1169474 RepID=A0A0G4G0I2_9ALVE|eukprot:Cvel_19549.t1-p1 / transcript=Cvel_19549.t1 / gene=Cvel_19549 / organism=Chromera_velia_CCMP2878 / gene_product=Riboflavin biosynthesis protein RibD, putative / transcript_product=Riboflavin biosynthesis protein RibD, putative / location=Cvel_scaffold1694:14106-15521(-) / protein_length=472 / sequence_SO=supercontig / SO=protein_coding / is_pseudo=false